MFGQYQQQQHLLEHGRVHEIVRKYFVFVVREGIKDLLFFNLYCGIARKRCQRKTYSRPENRGAPKNFSGAGDGESAATTTTTPKRPPSSSASRHKTRFLHMQDEGRGGERGGSQMTRHMRREEEAPPPHVHSATNSCERGRSDRTFTHCCMQARGGKKRGKRGEERGLKNRGRPAPVASVCVCKLT